MKHFITISDMTKDLKPTLDWLKTEPKRFLGKRDYNRTDYVY